MKYITVFTDFTNGINIEHSEVNDTDYSLNIPTTVVIEYSRGGKWQEARENLTRDQWRLIKDCHQAYIKPYDENFAYFEELFYNLSGL